MSSDSYKRQLPMLNHSPTLFEYLVVRTPPTSYAHLKNFHLDDKEGHSLPDFKEHAVSQRVILRA
ncbi:hypothetical protein [Salmonella phage vB-SalM-SJ3]|uniref:Uncharacterized protein n=2 Tax=Kuttervirus TaxID=2169536 RepID=X4YTX4_9CAUD|nr:hypothetical protein FF15_gp070 [Salmonella phage vB-SalM-SJ3]YP_009283839.1 hypothetical protein BI169_gp146 [Salmonella phage GG32]AHV82486.1 hypothetical protein [Salmonella phage vB-SalM-SJ3]ANN85913.1 hypothetical protein [Salmonella phage GG32]